MHGSARWKALRHFAPQQPGGISCPTSSPFPPFFVLTWPVIAYRLFTQDGGATRRCTATVIHLPCSPPSASSLSSVALFHPGRHLLLQPVSPHRGFSVSPLRLCSLLTAPPPSLLHPFSSNGLDGGQVRASAGLRGAEGMRATLCQGHAGRPYCARRAGGLRRASIRPLVRFIS